MRCVVVLLVIAIAISWAPSKGWAQTPMVSTTHLDVKSDGSAVTSVGSDGRDAACMSNSTQKRAEDDSSLAFVLQLDNCMLAVGRDPGLSVGNVEVQKAKLTYTEPRRRSTWI